MSGMYEAYGAYPLASHSMLAIAKAKAWDTQTGHEQRHTQRLTLTRPRLSPCIVIIIYARESHPVSVIRYWVSYDIA
jgi:hypothetical protein